MEGIVIAADPSHGRYLLRSAFNAPDDIDGEIRFHSDEPLQTGDIVRIKITAAYVYDLSGEFVVRL